MPSTVTLSFVDGLKSSLDFNKLVLSLARSTALRWCLFQAIFINIVLWSGGWILLTFLFAENGSVLFGWLYYFIISHVLYLLCLCINSFLFDQLAKEAIQCSQNVAPSALNYRLTIASTATIASSINSIIFYGNCALIVKLIRLVPYIGGFIGFPLTSIVLAYYCFEYKWIELGWTQEHRLSFVEYHWSYFLGFGLPLTLVTFFFPTLRAGAVFAFGFPTFVILATLDAAALNKSHSVSILPVFCILRALNKFTFALIRAGYPHISYSLMAQDRKDTLGKLV